MEPRSAVRRIALAQTLTGTGNGIASIALSFVVYERTDSAIWLAATLLLTFGLTGFLTPFAGKIADKYDRRLVMITSDLASLVVWLLLVPVSVPIALVTMGSAASVVALPFGFAATAAAPPTWLRRMSSVGPMV